jgi:uncharacterized protein (DUF2141 family)
VLPGLFLSTAMILRFFKKQVRRVETATGCTLRQATGAACLAGIAGGACLAAEPGVTVTVQPDRFRSDKGKLVCLAFNREKGFPERHELAFQRVSAPIAAGAASCTFVDLPPGKYAFAFLHDEDDNGEIRTNFFGFPVEGWGVSNDMPARGFGPPHFRDCVMDVQGDLRLTLKMRY